MKNSNRLARLESKKRKVTYPSFDDMYSTQTKTEYSKWLLLNNPCLTLADIDRLNIKTLSDFYE
jgi:hypothetical protein